MEPDALHSAKTLTEPKLASCSSETPSMAFQPSAGHLRAHLTKEAELLAFTLTLSKFLPKAFTLPLSWPSWPQSEVQDFYGEMVSDISAHTERPQEEHSRRSFGIACVSVADSSVQCRCFEEGAFQLPPVGECTTSRKKRRLPHR